MTFRKSMTVIPQKVYFLDLSDIEFDISMNEITAPHLS